MNSRTNYSSFWFDRQLSVVDILNQDKDDDFKPKPKKDHIALAGHKRAIGNFVRIVSGKNIPVKFVTRGDSCTDGKNVTISSNINENNFDHVVGLALHEGSHIAYSDFNAFRDVRNWSKIRTWDLTAERMEFFRGMINYIEDRRVDSIVFKSSPGYKGYYHELYNKYFNGKKVAKGLRSDMFRDLTMESYMFRIINFTNEGTVFGSLPRLTDIYRLIDMKNISRLKSTDDSIELAKSVCDIVFGLVEKSDGKGENKSEGKGGEEEMENGSGSPKGGDGTEVDTGDKKMTPDDSSELSDETGESSDSVELSDRQKKQIENMFKKQKEFLDGKTAKTKLTKNDSKAVEALGNSNTEMVKTGDENVGKIDVIMVPRLTKELIDSGAFGHIFRTWWRNDEKVDAINNGIRLGTILGKKLKVRGEEKDLIFTRQNSGKINKRLIAELGFGNENVFSQVIKEKYNKANLHISIDASGSMHGRKLRKAITSAVAICKAAEMAGNIRVVVDFRWTTQTGNKHLPVVIICYDSKKDKMNHIKSLWPHLTASGTTPESLCYEAIMRKFLGGVNGEDNYFINYSDGAPYFGGYQGSSAENHTRKMVKIMRNNGMKIISYFISDGDYYSDGAKHCFSRMYGKDANFIDATNMMSVAKSMNSKFLEK